MTTPPPHDALLRRCRAVLALHRPNRPRPGAYCSECGFRYPCLTVQLLVGAKDADGPVA